MPGQIGDPNAKLSFTEGRMGTKLEALHSTGVIDSSGRKGATFDVSESQEETAQVLNFLAERNSWDSRMTKVQLATSFLSSSEKGSCILVYDQGVNETRVLKKKPGPPDPDVT